MVTQSHGLTLIPLKTIGLSRLIIPWVLKQGAALLHTNDESIPKNGESFTFKLEGITKAYQLFRIVGTGSNSAKQDPFIGTSIFEFFGELYRLEK